MIPNFVKPVQSAAINRRGFLWSAAASTACVGVAGPENAATPETVHLVPPARQTMDIEGRNLGLITAYRPEFSSSDNRARNGELLADLAPFCGYLLVRGRYLENWGLLDQRASEIEAFLVFGNAEDSGNLKGLLRKYGKKYGQDSVVHKPYYQDAQLYALRDLPDLDMSERDAKKLGRFFPALITSYLTLMTKRGAFLQPFALSDLRSNPGSDRLGGGWEEIEFWSYRVGFYIKPHHRRVYFDETGIHEAS
jgi:hypothetical protein